jgi:hypothetical protein
MCAFLEYTFPFLLSYDLPSIRLGKGVRLMPCILEVSSSNLSRNFLWRRILRYFPSITSRPLLSVSFSITYLLIFLPFFIGTTAWDGCTNVWHQIAVATKLYTVVPNICGFSLWNPSDSYNLERVSIFLENLCTPYLKYWPTNKITGFFLRSH